MKQTNKINNNNKSRSYYEKISPSKLCQLPSNETWYVFNTHYCRPDCVLAKKENLLKSVLAGAASSRRDQYSIIHYSFIISQYQNIKDVY